MLNGRAMVHDALSRPLSNLRLSVTDRCNLRCAYCMPEPSYTWLPHRDLLRFEEISTLVDVFLALGVDKVRLTGGEPLLRRDLPVLVGMLAQKPGLKDLALTTNGVLLDQVAPQLARAGLHRLTVSLDTLRAQRFAALTRTDELHRVLGGIEAALRAGFSPLKLDTVLIRGTNDDELLELTEFAREVGAEIRFIEYMDVGGATQWSPDQVLTRSEILERLADRYGGAQPLRPVDAAPAERFRLGNGQTVGVIASMSAPFCRTCDRSRLTADGTWYQCLYAARGVDLKAPLRGGATASELSALVRRSWERRADRGAEERLQLSQRSTAFARAQLERDVRLEMHTRGG